MYYTQDTVFSDPEIFFLKNTLLINLINFVVSYTLPIPSANKEVLWMMAVLGY